MKRSQLEIMMEILEYCKQQHIITHVMYHVNLNCTVLRGLVDNLTDLGYLHISRVKRQGCYQTTILGLQVLSSYKEIQYLLTEIKLKEKMRKQIMQRQKQNKLLLVKRLEAT